jgi:hypothetical protein
MSVVYCRMVIRVHPDLPERLIAIQTHLFDETRLEYGYAAIVRGLIDLGLNQIEGAPHLAVLFAGCRIKRGRKPGWRAPTGVKSLDLSAEPDDMDLEYEDEHNDALGPHPKKEVVARERARRRRRPIRDAGLLEPKPAKHEDEDTDPGMDLDDADTADEEPDGL